MTSRLGRRKKNGALLRHHDVPRRFRLDKKYRGFVALDLGDVPGIEEGNEPPVSEKSSAVRVFESGEPITLTLEDITRDGLDRYGLQSVVHVPLKGRHGIVGVLSLGARRERAFCANELPFLLQIGSQVAIARVMRGESQATIEPSRLIT